jgi:hypothetical protein
MPGRFLSRRVSLGVNQHRNKPEPRRTLVQFKINPGFLGTTIRQGTAFEIIGHITTKSFVALEFHPVQPLGRRKKCLSQ